MYNLQKILFRNNKIMLGRWNIKKDICKLTIDYSNTDHCGICNDYLLNKLKNNLDNKSYNNYNNYDIEYEILNVNTYNKK
jgi:hypothetical protein